MASVADRYISKGGRTAGYGQKDFAEDLMCLADFLVWAGEDGAYYAGYHAKDAYLAAMRLLDMDPIRLRKIMLGEDEPDAQAKEVG